MTTPKTPDLAAVVERCREVQFERESAREQKRNVEKFYRDVDVMALCRAVEPLQGDVDDANALRRVAEKLADRAQVALRHHDALVEALAELTAACERVAEDLDERDVVMWADVSGNAAAAFELLATIEREGRS